MKKSFMNIKNFVDSNVRQRIDRVANHNNHSESLSDDLLSVERHFEDIRQVCVDADKKITALLQSIQLSSNPSHLGAYTQNVQAGLNNLSHNIGLQATNIASSNNSISTPISNNPGESGESPLKGSQQLAISGDSKSSASSNLKQQYQSSESLNIGSNTLRNSHDFKASHPTLESHCQLTEQQQLSDDVQQRYKKLPVVGFYKFLVKSSRKLKQDSLLAITLSQCSLLQIQLTNLYLNYERLIETRCLKPIQHMLETDIPNVLKLKKLYIKSHNDYEFLKTKYNGACHKQQQQLQNQQNAQTGHSTNTSYLISQNSIQQANTNKLDQLKNELDQAVTRSEQARDTYEAELYGFVCRETELVNLLKMFYRYQAEYHLQVGATMQALMPSLNDSLAFTPRKAAFGTQLSEHLRCTGRDVSPVIELCTHFLHLQGLKEEGLFRIPGSSVKIKKLKNGINAWFLSLASLDELQSDQKQRSEHHCVTALYDLFKSTIGQCVAQTTNSQQATTVAGSVLKSTLAADEAPLNQTNYPTCVEGNEDEALILDVHSVAGLLKLYLRELPEPLCTFSLYEDWIRCVDNKVDSETRLKMIASVIEKLPPTHRVNLRHLIQFLHLLTEHQAQNKMSSTNLAIAMAPSLMWSKSTPGVAAGQCDVKPDDAQSLNIQMSTFGISASHHAMILEALINNADALFPEPSDFTLPGFGNLKLTENSKIRSSARSRSAKSTSPTGLSTASSSSFSSNASNSTSPSTAVRGHSRKGGSMEGLLGGGVQDIGILLHQNHQNASIRSAGRPISVQLQRNEYSSSVRQNHQKPPPQKAPIPTQRSQSRQTSCDESQALHAPPRASTKPPAPPVPPPTTVRHQLERLKAAANSPSLATDDNSSAGQKPRPTSLRGTGTIEQTGSRASPPTATTPTGNPQLVARPTVPPPERPMLTTSSEVNHNEMQPNSSKPSLTETKDMPSKLNGCATAIAVAPPTISHLTAKGVDSEIELDLQAATSGSASDGDSSFDNDNESRHSLEQSWSKCSLSNGSPVEGETAQTTSSSSHHKHATDQPSESSSDSRTTQGGTLVGHKIPPSLQADNDPEAGCKPPVKPPRSMSPKITQSTPL